MKALGKRGVRFDEVHAARRHAGRDPVPTVG